MGLFFQRSLGIFSIQKSSLVKPGQQKPRAELTGLLKITERLTVVYSKQGGAKTFVPHRCWPRPSQITNKLRIRYGVQIRRTLHWNSCRFYWDLLFNFLCNFGCVPCVIKPLYLEPNFGHLLIETLEFGIHENCKPVETQLEEKNIAWIYTIYVTITNWRRQNR